LGGAVDITLDVMPSSIAHSRPRLHLLPVFAAVGLFSYGCTQEIASDFRDESMQSKLLTAGAARKAVSAASLVDSPDTLLCVLRPYEPKVQLRASAAAAEINRQLLHAGYVADDSHWALVAYKAGKPIRVAVVDQGDLRIARTQEDLCEPAAVLGLAYDSDGQVTLNRKGPAR